MMGTLSVLSFKIAKGLPSENDTVSSNILTFLFCNLREKILISLLFVVLKY